MPQKLIFQYIPHQSHPEYTDFNGSKNRVVNDRESTRIN